MNTQTVNLINFAMDKARNYIARPEFRETINEKRELLRQLQEALLPEMMWQDATEWSFGEVNERLAKLAKQGWELDGVVDETQGENGQEGVPGRLFFRFRRVANKLAWNANSGMPLKRGA